MHRPCSEKSPLRRHLRLAGELGFEPRLTESESAVLPLNYSPLVAQIAVNAYIFKSVKSDIRDEQRTSDARKPAHSGNNRTKVGTVFLPQHCRAGNYTALKCTIIFRSPRQFV